MDFADCLSLSSFTVGLRLIEKLNEHTESKTRSHSDRKNSIRYRLDYTGLVSHFSYIPSANSSGDDGLGRRTHPSRTCISRMMFPCNLS